MCILTSWVYLSKKYFSLSTAPFFWWHGYWCFHSSSTQGIGPHLCLSELIPSGWLHLSFKNTKNSKFFIKIFNFFEKKVIGLAHLKVFKLKAKLALLFCQSAISLALAITDTVNRNHLKNRPATNQEKSAVVAILVLQWIAFAIFFLLTLMRLIKQFKK